MFLTNAWHKMIRLASRRGSGHQQRRPRPARPLCLEPLEDRCLLSFTPGPLVLLSNPDPLASCPAKPVRPRPKGKS